MIKKIFGYHQGHVNKKVELYKKTPDGDIYLILAKDDRWYCIEKGEFLYRICHETSKEALDRNLLQEKSFLLMAKESVKATNLLRFDPQYQNRTIAANPAWFHLVDQIDSYLEIEKHNKAVKEAQALERHNLEVEKQEKEKAEREKYIQDARTLILNGKMVCCEALVDVADTLKVKIPLRTRGWLLNKGRETNADRCTYQPTKKSERGSTKVFEIYRSVKAAIEGELSNA